MKKLLSVAAVCVLLMGLMVGLVSAATITLTWSVEGADVDTQYYQLWVGDSDTTLERAGDPIPFSPLNPESPASLTTDYTLTVSDGTETTKWFSVSAIDTSGNECVPSDTRAICADKQPPIVSKTIDTLPPNPPTQLSVVINLVVQ